MIIYQYDGTLEGYLTAVYEARTINNDSILFNVKSEYIQMRFDTEFIEVESSEDKANELLALLKPILSARGVSDIIHAFESCDRQKDLTIYNYINLAFEQGRAVTTMLSHPYVVLFNDIVHKVRNEIHRMSGFIRFVKTKNEVYYSAYSPENNITAFLMPEFMSRFPIMSFVIHDVTRGILGIYNGNDYIIVHDKAKATIECAEDEKYIESLWQKYYQSVNIKERYNKKLMQSYMPKKYIENIHTFNDF